ncbi:MAG: hypothetical protein WC882_00585 [Candidatus Gracilibacteria bacterium]
MTRLTTALLGLTLATGCAPQPGEPLTREERSFLSEVLDETRNQVEGWMQDGFQTTEWRNLDIPVQSMEPQPDTTRLNLEAVQTHLSALPEILNQFNLETDAFTVDNCDSPHSSACVQTFSYSDVAQNRATREQVIEGAMGQPILFVKADLDAAIWAYNNPEPIETIYGDLPPEYSQGLWFCIGANLLAHEFVHVDGIGHNNETSYNDVASYVGDVMTERCLAPYEEAYREGSQQ